MSDEREGTPQEFAALFGGTQRNQQFTASLVAAQQPEPEHEAEPEPVTASNPDPNDEQNAAFVAALLAPKRPPAWLAQHHGIDKDDAA